MLKDEFRVASAEQLPRALCERQLCQGLKATYVRLKAAAELGPLLTDLFVRKDFAKPDKAACCAKPASNAHSMLVSEGVRGAEAWH